MPIILSLRFSSCYPSLITYWFTVYRCWSLLGFEMAWRLFLRTRNILKPMCSLKVFLSLWCFLLSKICSTCSPPFHYICAIQQRCSDASCSQLGLKAIQFQLIYWLHWSREQLNVCLAPFLVATSIVLKEFVYALAVHLYSYEHALGCVSRNFVLLSWHATSLSASIARLSYDKQEPQPIDTVKENSVSW